MKNTLSKKQTKKSPLRHFLKKLNIKLSFDPEILLLGIIPQEIKNMYSKKYLYMNVHSSTVHSS